ncbi:MAG TPA: C69 family dipeptidase [Ignavibacteriaceae bacterium]|nr:C69 family dipeptidase [Ignavibacteriaceae bacterium]
MQLGRLSNIFISILMAGIITTFQIIAQDKISEERADWEGGEPDGCTTIAIGKLASYDGSVMTSHTDDSHRTRSNMDIVFATRHERGSLRTLYKRENDDSQKMPAYKDIPTGKIPQVDYTHGYINTAYACINDKQVAIGETTFGGREELKSEKGLIDCQRLCQLMLERGSTARDAIKIAGELLEQFGWCDYGEMLTIVDPNEAWVFEVVGPGKDKMGAVWVAQRVPDDQIFVGANGSRIRQIDVQNPDYFMFSKNVFDVAKVNGWWKPENGPLEFCYAYAERNSLAARRREWRVFDLVAPSLKLDPWSENYPFSVKPDSLITLEKMVRIFSDYYEGTEFDMTKNLTVTDDSGRTIISPLANPHMPYDMNKLFKINGGWGWLGERTIARWYTMYATIIQCRSWLPDEIGGLVWLAWDNVSTSIYTPFYCGITRVNKTSATDGRMTGFSKNSAWWAFNRLGTLAAQRWGEMRHDVRKVWDPMQKELFTNQKKFEDDALKHYSLNRDDAKEFLTKYCHSWQEIVVERAWLLGDELWTKYDEKF